MESKKLEKPRKNGAFSTRQAVTKPDEETGGVFQDIENGDPILAGRFHADVVAVVFCKPVTQLLQTFGKGREAGLPVFGTAFGIGNANAGIDPGFVDIKATTIEFKDFKGQNR